MTETSTGSQHGHGLTTVAEVYRLVVGLGPAEVVGPIDGVVTSCSHDSRSIQPGDLFFCVPGERVDGHEMAAAAAAAGAVALICERPLDVALPQILVPSVRAVMGPVAARLAGDPSQKLRVFGVTGTNGKTTVVILLSAIFERAAWLSLQIGTLTGARTTPEAPELQVQLASAYACGMTAVAMEVSSHALDQGRMNGTTIDVAGFTNLSTDHLDYHKTMESYFAAKAELFRPGRARRAVVNVDDPRGLLLKDSAQIPTIGISIDDVDSISLTASGSEFTWHGRPVRLPLVGLFNVRNALVAAEMALAGGISPDVVVAGLESASPPPGRMEIIDEGQTFSLIVDYAHTPDGLEKVIAALRDLEPARIIVVFGAGGDRDRTKRPLMAAAAAAADLIFLTSDNPRSEDPDAIIEEVRAGFPSPGSISVEPDRAQAIALAIAHAQIGDVVLIAGKGHESTQDLGTKVIPFDDREVARRLLREERP